MKKYYSVTMGNGDVYGIPAEVIAENYARFYEKINDESFEENVETMMFWFDTNDFEFADWAKNNMDWDDVKDQAVLLGQADIPVDFQEGWVNGEYGYLVREE